MHMHTHTHTHTHSAKVLVKGEPNVSYICSRYYRALELIFGTTDYTCDIGRFSNHLGFCQRVKKGGWSIPLF